MLASCSNKFLGQDFETRYIGTNYQPDLHVDASEIVKLAVCVDMHDYKGTVAAITL